MFNQKSAFELKNLKLIDDFVTINETPKLISFSWKPLTLIGTNGTLVMMGKKSDFSTSQLK